MLEIIVRDTDSGREMRWTGESTVEVWEERERATERFSAYGTVVRGTETEMVQVDGWKLDSESSYEKRMIEQALRCLNGKSTWTEERRDRESLGELVKCIARRPGEGK